MLGFKETWGKQQVKAGRLRTQTWAPKVVMVPRSEIARFCWEREQQAAEAAAS
jgi:hypothetical protein